MCVVIQNSVFDWSEGDSAGGEGKAVSRFGCTGGAAGVSSGACAHLAPALSLLESRRPLLAASAFNTQKKKKKAPPAEKHNSPDHIQYEYTDLTKTEHHWPRRLPILTQLIALRSQGKWGWEVLGRQIKCCVRWCLLRQQVFLPASRWPGLQDLV